MTRRRCFFGQPAVARCLLKLLRFLGCFQVRFQGRFATRYYCLAFGAATNVGELFDQLSGFLELGQLGGVGLEYPNPIIFDGGYQTGGIVFTVDGTGEKSGAGCGKN